MTGDETLLVDNIPTMQWHLEELVASGDLTYVGRDLDDNPVYDLPETLDDPRRRNQLLEMLQEWSIRTERRRDH